MFLVVGFGLNRLKILPKGAGGGVSKLVTTVFLPALLIHSNMTEFRLAEVGSYGGNDSVLFWGAEAGWG